MANIEYSRKGIVPGNIVTWNSIPCIVADHTSLSNHFEDVREAVGDFGRFLISLIDGDYFIVDDDEIEFISDTIILSNK